MDAGFVLQARSVWRSSDAGDVPLGPYGLGQWLGQNVVNPDLEQGKPIPTPEESGREAAKGNFLPIAALVGVGLMVAILVTKGVFVGMGERGPF